jgi:hypothetical protein
MLSPDGRDLCCTRGGDIYRVDAAVVEQAKRQALRARSRCSTLLQPCIVTRNTLE